MPRGFGNSQSSRVGHRHGPPKRRCFLNARSNEEYREEIQSLSYTERAQIRFEAWSHKIRYQIDKSYQLVDAFPGGSLPDQLDSEHPPTESTDLLNGDCRLVVTCNRHRYWCASPKSPQAWKRNLGSPLRSSSAVVLTAMESNSSVGELSVASLNEKVCEFWGGILPPSVTTSPLYQQWLEYFIRLNHDYGVVHAFVSALREWLMCHWTYVGLYSELKVHSILMPQINGTQNVDLMEPEQYEGSDGDHEVLAGLVSPPLKRLTETVAGKTVISRGSDRGVRRIWDVCANRVVPAMWFPPETLKEMVILSHGWVAPAERKCIRTPVTCDTWPVPIPRDIDIEDIRTELIRRNVRFAWLDILCLRQEMEPYPGWNSEQDNPYSQDVIDERRRRQLKEWESDVPLIGAIYRAPKVSVLVYLNGVGRPCIPGGWRDERHWLRRAWTLQEVVALEDMQFAGLDDNGKKALLNCSIDAQGTTVKQAIDISALGDSWSKHFDLDLSHLIIALQDRCSSNPVDRVGSLLYFCIHPPENTHLTSSVLPAYHYNETPDMAWKRLVHAAAHVWTAACADCPTGGHFVEQLMTLFPHPSAEHWFPSWAQLMSYPDVSVQEPQLPDSSSPQMDYSLRLNGGHLYRGVNLRMVTDHEGGIAYAASVAGSSAASTIMLYPTNTLPDQPAINPEEQYVLIDLCPFIRETWRPRPIPARRSHLLVICRELTQWEQPVPQSTSVTQTGFASTKVSDAHRYHYRLRRVTSLKWDSEPDEFSWLPFTSDLTPTQSGLHSDDPTTNYARTRTLWLWDPSIIVTLQ